MGDVLIPGPVLAILVPAISFLVLRLLQAKDSQIASEREDKMAYRAALFDSMKTANRATNVAERATNVIAAKENV